MAAVNVFRWAFFLCQITHLSRTASFSAKRCRSQRPLIDERLRTYQIFSQLSPKSLRDLDIAPVVLGRDALKKRARRRRRRDRERMDGGIARVG